MPARETMLCGTEPRSVMERPRQRNSWLLEHTNVNDHPRSAVASDRPAGEARRAAPRKFMAVPAAPGLALGPPLGATALATHRTARPRRHAASAGRPRSDASRGAARGRQALLADMSEA